MTDTTLSTLPDTEPTLTEKAKAVASSAGEKIGSAASTATDRVSSAASTAGSKVSSATSATIGAAKEHPVAAAGIVAGVAAAVVGGVYAASKLSEPAPKAKRAPKKK